MAEDDRQLEEIIQNFEASLETRLDEQSTKLSNAVADDRKEMKQGLDEIGAP